MVGLSEAGTYSKDVKISAKIQHAPRSSVPSDAVGKSFMSSARSRMTERTTSPVIAGSFLNQRVRTQRHRSHMKTNCRKCFIGAIACLVFAFAPFTSHAADGTTRVPPKRLRVIVTSDFPPFPVTNSDPDDVQSMVRFLLYANEFDVEGLIASAGTTAWSPRKRTFWPC